jgi:hypothetical protein
MKLLTILASDNNQEVISRCVKPLGFDVIRYKHVLKAMDNIDEIDPTGIIISASDFPRHWKPLVQFVRAERSKETTPIIILHGDNFLLDETNKAFYLGVNGVFFENLEEAMEIDRLQNILKNAVPAGEKQKANISKFNQDTPIAFMFSHPENGKLITGTIKDISQTGLTFQPDNINLVKDISLSTEIPLCSLRLGSEIISPLCKLIRAGDDISLKFVQCDEFDQNVLNEYFA